MEENASEVTRCIATWADKHFLGSGCCGFWKKKITRIMQAPMVLPVVLVIFFPWFQWLRRGSKSNNQWAQKVPFNSWDFFWAVHHSLFMHKPFCMWWWKLKTETSPSFFCCACLWCYSERQGLSDQLVWLISLLKYQRDWVASKDPQEIVSAHPQNS